MEFCARLKELRRKKGVSQEKLAAEIHISRSAVAKWEAGLGLPSEDSVRLLAEYFGIPENQLLGKVPAPAVPVSKEKGTVHRRFYVFFTVLITVLFCAAALFFIKPLRRNFPLMMIGIGFILLGIFNYRGNISSVHWYHRRKVSKEDQPAYCRCIGGGTAMCGIAMIIAAAFPDARGVLFCILFIGGLLLMLYAQFKYNRGLF